MNWLSADLPQSFESLRITQDAGTQAAHGTAIERLSHEVLEDMGVPVPDVGRTAVNILVRGVRHAEPSVLRPDPKLRNRHPQDLGRQKIVTPKVNEAIFNCHVAEI